MAFDGSGNYTLTYTFATEAASPPIAISKLDTEFSGIATALSACMLRNGTGKPTAEQDWNGQKLSNMAASTTRLGAPTTGQVQDGGLVVLGSVAGTNTITGSLTPAITAYATGMRVVFEPAGNNTGATTININSLGAKSIKKWDGDALEADDLVSGVPAILVYDGTQFYLMNPCAFWGSIPSEGFGYKNVPINSQSGNYTLLLTDAGKCIYHDAAAGSGDVYTIPANASVAFPVGTVVTFVNLSGFNVSIAITSDTMRLAGTGSTGTRTLGSYGIATALKVESTVWLINGNDIT